MVANYYPNAWTRIRDREAQLSVADADKLHIQYMVCLRLFKRTMTDLISSTRVRLGALVIPARTYPTLLSHSTTIIAITNGIHQSQPPKTVIFLPPVATTEEAAT